MKRLKYKDYCAKREHEWWHKCRITNEEWAEGTDCELIDVPDPKPKPRRKGCPRCGALHTNSLCGDCWEDHRKETGSWIRRAS